MPGVEDNLVNGWTAEDKRSLLDLVTGGKYSEAKDLPPLSTTGKITDENISSLLDVFSEKPDVEYTGGPGPLLGALTTVGVIRTASTASKLFAGWRDNLLQFMKSASKKDRGRVDYIVREAMGIFDADDIKTTKHGLNIINKEFGLTGKVVVPEVKGAAGGKMRQATKTKGRSTAQKRTVESPKRIEQKETAKKVKKESRTGGEPKHQRGAKLVRKY